MRALSRIGLLWRKRSFLGLGIVVASLTASGCSSSTPSAPTEKTDVPEPAASVDNKTPEDQLYEQLRAGNFQMGAAASSIAETLSAAQELIEAVPKNGDLAEGLSDATDLVDSAGAGIAEYGDDPPAKEDVSKNFSAFDDKRLKAVEAGNNALHDLREASGLFESLEEEAPASFQAKIAALRSLLAVAVDDLWSAIEAYGGTPEPAEEPKAP